METVVEKAMRGTHARIDRVRRGVRPDYYYDDTRSAVVYLPIVREIDHLRTGKQPQLTRDRACEFVLTNQKMGRLRE